MRVLHVVAMTERRDTELPASDLVRALGNDGARQCVAVLRDGGRTRERYEAPTILLDSGGLRIPFLRLDVASLSDLRGFIREWEPDVLHGHGGEALTYLVFATLKARLPIVYRRDSEAASWVTSEPRRSTYAALMRRTTRIVVVTEAMRRETIEVFNISPRKVVTIPEGFDPCRLEPTIGREALRHSLGIPTVAPVILSLGTLGPGTDPLAHLEVLRLVLCERADTVLVFAGDGPLRRQLEEAVKRDGLEDRALVLGARTDVGDLLAASDVLLLAGRDTGKFGPLIEAGMTGLPVVGYEISGVREVVEDGATGFLVAPGNVRRLASRVIQLLQDDPARHAMGEAARERCRAFEIGKIAPRYLEVYRRASEAA